ncbi:MAG: CBS domain-containing protein [Euryarchaeota archaeon]|nr:CBS domain-containing protein [Euryarchaeota archaeon]
MENTKVKTYMSRNVTSVDPDMSIEELKNIMRETNHDGFPVIKDGRLMGMVTARDLVLREQDTKVKNVMTKKVMVTFPDTNLTDAARVMFRKGFSRLPVVDKEGRVIGIVTNTDVIRSHIERVTPGKVRKLTESLESLYGIRTIVRMGTVRIDDLIPTQGKVMPDEFRGREYEIKRGLAEPIVVIKTGERLVLVDGHHRTLAARSLGLEEINAYIIVLSRDIELGLERTARQMGLHTIDDIKIVKEVDTGIVGIIDNWDEEEDS